MDPITREEMYLAAAAGYNVEPPEPITRKEVFLAKLAGMDVETPAPFTRRERFIEEAAMAENNAVIEPLQVTENGTYTAPTGVDGYNPVTVNVPAPEVKLQDKTISENGEYTADSGFDGLGKVTVDVAGSGGGSLLPGLYYLADSMPLPIRYGQRFFKYGGSLYLVARPAATGSGDTIIYKYENQSWTKLLEVPNATVNSDFVAIEFNGKLHFCAPTGGAYNKKHSVYDGNTVTALNELPAYCQGEAYFVQDGKLKAYSYKSYNVYVWDEETDSWESEANFGGSGEEKKYFTEYNGTTYCVDLKNLRISSYSDGKLTYLYDIGTSENPTIINAFVGKYVYCTYPNRLYKINVENGDVTDIGEMTRVATGSGKASVYYVDGYGLRLHGCDYAAPNTFFNMIMYEVTE